MAYDGDISDDDDAEALKAERRAELEALRARLRAKAARLVEVIETMGDPENVSDAWRAVRLVRQADTMVIQLYAEPGMILSSATGRGMQPVGTASPRTEAPDDDAPTPEQKHEAFKQKVDRLIMGYARQCGFWPNGDVFDSFEAISHEHMPPSLPYAAPCDYSDLHRLRHGIVTHINASIHHQAKSEGQWPDGSPFDAAAENPGYYSATKGESCKTDDEDIGPSGAPWWIVRQRPPETEPTETEPP